MEISNAVSPTAELDDTTYRVIFEPLRSKEYVRETKPIVEVAGHQFTALSSEEISRQASVKVLNPDIYMSRTDSGTGRPAPMQFGLLDDRFGCRRTDPSCKVCGQDWNWCPGHFGALHLPEPVFHIGFFKYLKRILTCLCRQCGTPLIDDGDKVRYREIMRKNRIEDDKNSSLRLFQRIQKICEKVKECFKCGAPQGKLKAMQKPDINCFLRITESLETRDDNGRSIAIERDLSPLYLQTLFKRLTRFDLEVLNIAPPENLLTEVVPVPPTSVRPSIHLSGLQSNEDDITATTRDMAKTVRAILVAQQRGHESRDVQNNFNVLTLLLAKLINPEAPGIKQIIATAGDKPGRGICQRLKGKEGRFRSNLSGKRVDFSGRTVISPDPNANVDQVVVPEWQARRLTFPDRVTSLNIDKLRQRVLNGPDNWPGAVYIHFSDGAKKHLRFANRRQMADALKPGDAVERHMQDDDIVLFNRQPSLHRLSIMALRAKVRPFRTLRFNECACQPFNADFDGDEMNIHLPQTQEARAEAYHLMGVQNNLVTPKNGEPLVHATQDFLSGTYMICNKDVFMSRDEFWQAVGHFTDGTTEIEIPPPTILKPKELWTGKQVIAVMLRPNRDSNIMLNFSLKEREYVKPEGGRDPVMCLKDGCVFMRRSELMCGAIGKKTIGGTKVGMIFHLLRNNSSTAACMVMNRIAQLCGRWFCNRGMTIGIDDVTAGPVIEKAVRNVIQTGYDQCKDLHEQYIKGQLQPDPGCTLAQTWEGKTKGVLDGLRGLAGDAVNERLHPMNKPLIMLLSGAKGAVINIAQMVACVGQQNVNGQRPWNGFVGRTLPHYKTGDVSARAKGFVESSFYSGLHPDEFWFHTMSGREGLVDTAVKTADTGYMQRRLIKSLEDLSVVYDTSVRTSDGNIVQFVYGDDGMNPTMMEQGTNTFMFDDVFYHVASYVRRPPAGDYVKLPMPVGAGNCDDEVEGHYTRSKRQMKERLEEGRKQKRLKQIEIDGDAHRDTKEVDRDAEAEDNNEPTVDQEEAEVLLRTRSVLPPKDGVLSNDIIGGFWRKTSSTINLHKDANGNELSMTKWTEASATLIQQKLKVLDASLNCMADRDLITTRESGDVPVNWLSAEHQRTREGEPPSQNICFAKNIMIAVYVDRGMNARQSLTPLLPYELLAWGLMLADATQEFVSIPVKRHEKINIGQKQTHQKGTAEAFFFFRSDMIPGSVDELLIHKGKGYGRMFECLFQHAEKLSLKRVADGREPALNYESYFIALRSYKGGRYAASSYQRDATEAPSVMALSEFLQVCWRKFVRAQIEPGEAQGAVAAQSIGEPGTQMTLKTFHFAGVASMNVTLGVPRIKEIINAAKNISTPVMNVPLIVDDDEGFAVWVRSKLQRTNLADIVDSVQEVYSSSHVALEVVLSPHKIRQMGLDLTAEEVVSAIDRSKVKVQKKGLGTICKGSVLDPYRVSITATADNMERGRNLFLMNIIAQEIGKVHVSGLENVKRGVVKKELVKTDDGGTRDKFSLVLEGVDVLKVMGTEGVYYPGLTYNHVMGVVEVFGIEAARAVIINEIRGCMEAYGMEIDLRHMMLLGDVMTFRGEVLGISRHGIQKMRASTYMLATFEETNEHLFSAAVQNKFDKCDGVSESILVGKNVCVGTGSFALCMRKPKKSSLLSMADLAVDPLKRKRALSRIMRGGSK